MLAVTIILIVSYVYAAYVYIRNKLALASNYSLYLFFSLIYSVFPILTYYGIEPQIWFAHFSLHESEMLVSIQVGLIAVCNIVFASTYHALFRKPSQSTEDLHTNHLHNRYGNMLFIGYMLFCGACVVAGWTWGYTSGRGEMISSVISKAKVVLAAMYVVYLVLYGLNYRTAIMFLGYLALMLVEHTRWYFFSVLLTTMIYAQDHRRISNRLVLTIGAVLILLMSYVGLYRCNVDIKYALLLLNPLYIEGDYGSYAILQTYDLIMHGRILFYTMFSDYIIDPIIYIIPRPLFMGFGVSKEGLGILAAFSREHQHYLTEQYSPVGGFNYIAQASSALPFLGPIIVTYALARLTIAIEKLRTQSMLKSLVNYVYAASFFFVFLKTRFDITMNYFITFMVTALFVFMTITGLSNWTTKAKGKHSAGDGSSVESEMEISD